MVNIEEKSLTRSMHIFTWLFIFSPIAMTFRGQVYFYKNINGKETKLQESFDDAESYQAFIDKHQEEFTFPSGVRPRFNQSRWQAFEEYMDQLEDAKQIDRDDLRQRWKALTR